MGLDGLYFRLYRNFPAAYRSYSFLILYEADYEADDARAGEKYFEC